ncbi:unnamed protein product [Paramecium pentaurelia]|uniref:Uncharacterized protein n=1 Tax=Paramecium pentaurelia TaxID=43138 RepID=A0A8S1XAA2_9CILI|nr:unnamed protein product [Paramecium pentaurelia]
MDGQQRRVFQIFISSKLNYLIQYLSIIFFLQKFRIQSIYQRQILQKWIQLYGTYSGLYCLEETPYYQIFKHKVNYKFREVEQINLKKGKNFYAKLELFTQKYQEKINQEKKKHQSNICELIKENQLIKTKEYFTVILKKKRQLNSRIGCDKYIKIFEFKQGIMKIIQLISKYSNIIATLNLMKKTNLLILRSFRNRQIIIQLIYQNNQQIVHKKQMGAQKEYPVEFLIIMRIYLYQVVSIDQLNSQSNRMKGHSSKQQICMNGILNISRL